MNDFVNSSHSTVLNSEVAQGPLTLNEVTWWKKSISPEDATLPIRPISPLSFAFMTEDERTAFKFPERGYEPEMNKPKDEEEEQKADDSFVPNKNNSESTSSVSTSASLSDSSPPLPRKTFKINDLLVVEDDNESTSSPDGYEPKAHLGWASFGASIQPPPPPAKRSPAPAQPRRKVYVIRPQNREKAKPYQVHSHKIKKGTPETIIPPKPKTSSVTISDSDEDVDVVGVDEEDDTLMRKTLETGHPPDLPPQRSLGSRFESKRVKRDNRRSYDSDDDDMTCPRSMRSFSPPPHLEIQKNDSSATEKNVEKDPEQEQISGEDRVEKRFGLEDVNPSQILKTKISSSAIPILPLSKSIMERKKVALEMTKNAVIKKAPPPRLSLKNFTVAPKNVQIPAYTDNAPITFYSNFNKSLNGFQKDARGRCVRCRDRSPVDMSSFKFVDDSTVVAVRAHLCDQTRVMIARTAIWNREYAKRLGDRAVGTVWQKPDEVTAQMTGFCSATIRRCIDIANLSIVPRCADRVGVSKNQLTSLKSSFGTEKFCGQTMRTPHVLTQYYSVKVEAAAAAVNASKASSSSDGPPPISRLAGKPPTRQLQHQSRNEEEDRKHHPLTYYQPTPVPQTDSQTTTQSPSFQEQSLPPLKKTVLRWTSIQVPRILRPTNFKSSFAVPKTAVIPVIKKKEPEIKKVAGNGNAIRRRGRPKKEQKAEVTVKPLRASTRRLRSSKNNLALIPVDNEIQETVKFLVNTVSEEVSNEMT